MSRFNARTARPSTVRSPLQGTGERTTTYEGAPAYLRTEKTDLVLLALSNFHDQDTFYEKAADRDDRFRTLVRSVAASDPAWTGAFITWLRGDAHMRTASLVAAAEAAHTLIGLKVPGARKAVDGALQRADEPGEFLAYWEQAYGTRKSDGRYAPQLPMAVKRGLGDAAIRLYTERSALKYDTASHAKRFADVLELTHPGDTKGAAQHLQLPWQPVLFKYLVDRRHGHGEGIPAQLRTLIKNAALRIDARENPEFLLDPDKLRAAGMTWEDSLSLAGEVGLDKRSVWEAMIPNMAYMALLRNLRNFDQAGIGATSYSAVVRKLTDPDEVARSRQLPFRFLSAHKELDTLKWAQALETALDLSLANVPVLPGRTLVLVDLSGSMYTSVSKKSKIQYWEAGALFGAALAARGGDVTLVSYGTTHEIVPVRQGMSTLKLLEKVSQTSHRVGWGTDTAHSLQATYAGHDQVFVFTDGQSWGSYSYGGGDVSRSVPASVPLFAFNLAGYGQEPLDLTAPNRYAIGGFSPKLFNLVKVLLDGDSARWPWEE